MSLSKGAVVSVEGNMTPRSSFKLRSMSHMLALGAGAVLVVIAGFALHAVVRGTPDAYHNQHLRLLSISLGGALSAAGVHVQRRTRSGRVSALQVLCIAAVFGCLAWSLYLAM